MKLKFYLRGLGIGIVVTALIMGIGMKDRRPMTDAEIKAAALKLGMVESDSLKLSDLPREGETAEPSPSPEGEPTSLPTVESGQGQEGEDIPQGGEPTEPTPTPDAEPTEPSSSPDAETTEPTSTPTAEPTPTPDTEPESTPDQSFGSAETITVIISRGTGSGTVCRQLEEAGLIEDAAAFDQYLIDGGYSKRISAGTFEIPVGASEEEIAKIISRSR